LLHSVTLNKRESILSVQESSTQNPSNHAKPEKVKILPTYFFPKRLF